MARQSLATEPKAHPAIVRMEGIVKRFPGVTANDHVNFEVRAGEIHALLGENGAGKTTLMNILYGLYRADEGGIYIRGERVKIRSPRDAIKLGIGMVHQHFMLVRSHTVAENMALGLMQGFLLNLKEVKRRIAELSEQYGLKVDPGARIWQLSTGEQQRVEILRVLLRGADILILDEPTSVLTPLEVGRLFDILRRMAEEGHSVVFITHKLDEALAISDRITVLRRGRVVMTARTGETTKEELAKAMVGRRVLFDLERGEAERGEKVLEVKDLRVLNDRGLLAVKGVSLSIHEGEILGIIGVAGNGQQELVEAITGLRKPIGGKVFINGADVTGSPPRKILEQGVAYVPDKRLGVGVVPSMSVVENLILRTYRYAPFSNGLLLNRAFIDQYADGLISKFNIMTPSRDASIRSLSGGNIQRLILARELSGRPRLIVAANPTRGLDVALTEYACKQLLKRREEGTAILLVSEDLDEVLSLSDRIAVIYEGRIVREMPAEGASIEEIGLAMAGA